VSDVPCPTCDGSGLALHASVMSDQPVERDCADCGGSGVRTAPPPPSPGRPGHDPATFAAWLRFPEVSNYGEVAARTLTPDTRTDDPSPDDPMYLAWTIIANARDWLLDDPQAAEWRAAAERFRDEVFHSMLNRGGRVVYGDVPNGATIEECGWVGISHSPLYRVREEPTDG
jgi:hypothetical protein